MNVNRSALFFTCILWDDSCLNSCLKRRCASHLSPRLKQDACMSLIADISGQIWASCGRYRQPGWSCPLCALGKLRSWGHVYSSNTLVRLAPSFPVLLFHTRPCQKRCVHTVRSLPTSRSLATKKQLYEWLRVKQCSRWPLDGPVVGQRTDLSRRFLSHI